MLKTSMSDYEKSSVVTYPFYFINQQSIHKTNCMQKIKKILMWEVFPAIALKCLLPPPGISFWNSPKPNRCYPLVFVGAVIAVCSMCDLMS